MLTSFISAPNTLHTHTHLWASVSARARFDLGPLRSSEAKHIITALNLDPARKKGRDDAPLNKQRARPRPPFPSPFTLILLVDFTSTQLAIAIAVALAIAIAPANASHAVILHLGTSLTFASRTLAA